MSVIKFLMHDFKHFWKRYMALIFMTLIFYFGVVILISYLDTKNADLVFWNIFSAGMLSTVLNSFSFTNETKASFDMEYYLDKPLNRKQLITANFARRYCLIHFMFLMQIILLLSMPLPKILAEQVTGKHIFLSYLFLLVGVLFESAWNPNGILQMTGKAFTKNLFFSLLLMIPFIALITIMSFIQSFGWFILEFIIWIVLYLALLIWRYKVQVKELANKDI